MSEYAYGVSGKTGLSETKENTNELTADFSKVKLGSKMTTDITKLKRSKYFFI